MTGISAADYGASPTATWQQNRDAINAAIDVAYANGGGRVLLPSGDLAVKGIIQKAHVEIAFQTTRLIHPDGDGIHIIASDVAYTTGSIAAGSRTLNVASAVNIAVGAVLAIRGAGGRNEAAIWELDGAIDGSQTGGITLLTPTTGLFADGGFLIVDDEIIEYTGLSGSTLTGVTRGALGTTAAAHDGGTWIAQSIRLYARVEAVSGTTITLDQYATVGVSDAAIDIGPAGLAITGLARFYGNRPPGGSSTPTYPVYWLGVGGGKIDAIDAEQCDAALMLGRGTSGCQIGPISAHQCGNAPVQGSAVWLFRGACNNYIEEITVTGSDTYTGLYLDDRTASATEYDGPCNDNKIGPVNIKRPFFGTSAPGDGIGINITGCARNVIGPVNINGLRFGIVFAGRSQNERPDGSANPNTYGNIIYGGAVDNCFRPWSCTAPGNSIIGLWWRSVQGASGDSTEPVTLVGVSDVSGAPPVIGQFQDGTPLVPGITFANAAGTGFYLSGGTDVGVAIGNTRRVRFRPGMLEFNDGYNMSFTTSTGTMIGTGVTQKIGFWGRAPVARPGAIADATDEASAVAQLNTLLSTLRALGLIAS